MTDRAGKPFTGWHMLLLIASFFSVIVAVNLGMAVVASTSWTGLVVANSYVASQEFEEKQIAHERQQQAGWRISFDFSAGEASLRVVDGAGKVVHLGEVTLKVNRPVGGHDDQTVRLERTGDGSYTAALDLTVGTWDALVSAADTVSGPFELHSRFSVADGAK